MTKFVATNRHFETARTLGAKLAAEDIEKGIDGSFFWDVDLDHNDQDILFLITNEKIDPDEEDANALLDAVEDSYYDVFDDREIDYEGDYEDQQEDSEHH